jgi:hypothetical protein
MTTQVPQKNGTLRSLRKYPVTEYMTGGMGEGFNVGALGEDLAAKFLSCGKNKHTFQFNHWICTYSSYELNSRLDSLKRVAQRIREFGIVVEEESNFANYKLILSK